jgi:acetylornithine deacetylase/succinyl-diaminopimelate desuccinylase-like protein
MTASAQLRIARLAATPAVHRAFHWLHIHQLQIRRWQLEILRIPAPPFGEQARAAWFLEQFHSLGLANPHIDEAGNALAELGAGGQTSSDLGTPTPPLILLSAHLDTVFPTELPIEPIELETRIVAPGACDNAAGLSGLLALAAGMRHAELAPAVPILFAANVGEEGEGDLRGMRHLFTASPYASRIAAAIALEGGGSSAVVTRALASRRFRVTVTGPGGHSWIDAGVANPILVLARALLALESLDLPQDEPRTTLNVGQISGGTSINSIPESATALLDLRSTDSTRLHEAGNPIHRAAIRSPWLAVLARWGGVGVPTRAAAPPSPSRLSAIDPAAHCPTTPRCSPPSAPSIAISACAPNPASARPTRISRSPAAFPPSLSAPEASAAASTPCRSGTTPPAAPPRSAASSSPCLTSPIWRPTHPSPPNRVGSPLFAPSAQAFQAIAA